MHISPSEAEESLAAIQQMTKKTRRSIAKSGSYIFLIITGIVWLIGFLATQFLEGSIVAYIWIAMSILGAAVSIPLGRHQGRRVYNPMFQESAKRAGLFWLMLILFCIATIAVTGPLDGKQITMLIILYIMIGQLAMGLLISFSSTWWALPIAALALLGYFLLPGLFYLWMGVLIGGGMIALGVTIRLRW
jgi:hypothetical protein